MHYTAHDVSCYGSIMQDQRCFRKQEIQAQNVDVYKQHEHKCNFWQLVHIFVSNYCRKIAEMYLKVIVSFIIITCAP